ncbi:MAG: 30S ribosomal protein S3 [archaeon]
MIEKKFVVMKKNEFEIKEFVTAELGKGRISKVFIERTPLGERVIVSTCKPGLIIGRRGEKIAELTETLKRKFNMENPHIEIMEIKSPELDAQYVGEEMALSLERFGSMSFKIIAYKMLERIKAAGAMGAEIRLSGKLPGERAKSWRFSFGFLKKTGDQLRFVDRIVTVAHTRPGAIGVQVDIVPPGAEIEEKVFVSKDIIMQSIQSKEVAMQAAEKEAENKKGKKEEKQAAENKKEKKEAAKQAAENKKALKEAAKQEAVKQEEEKKD